MEIRVHVYACTENWRLQTGFLGDVNPTKKNYFSNQFTTYIYEIIQFYR